MNELFSLEGKIAIVTGTLGNLGPVWTRTFLAAGATVVGIDLPGAKINAEFGNLQEQYGGKLALYRASVLDREALSEIREVTRREYGIPDVLVNNAGIDQPPNLPCASGLFEDIPIDICRSILEVNTLGALQVAQVFAPAMVQRRRGSIINIGSLYAGVAPDPHFYDHINPPFLKPPAYGASKAALINLTRYLAALWGPSGVRVNALSPGGVLGGQDPEFKRKFCARVPLGRMAVMEDLVGPMLFLASDASAYVTGTELKVDGGFTAW